MPARQPPPSQGHTATASDTPSMCVRSDRLMDIARTAGEQIMSIYQTPFDVTLKDDDSPVTRADELASAVITQALTKLADWPVLSEENHIPEWPERQHWRTYWLVDPLDGTKEFIKKNGEFSVNIALIHEHQPVQSIIHAPATGEYWWGQRGNGAWYAADQAALTNPVALKVNPVPEPLTDWRVLSSRSWQSDKSRHFRSALGVPDACWDAVGSSLKMCRIAQGKAHLYVRLGPTSEWDTAAAQIILEEAGGVLLNADTVQTLDYNRKPSLLNPWFVAASGYDSRWEQAISDTKQWVAQQAGH